MYLHHILLQRRGGWQGVASLRGQRAPGPSGSSRLLAWCWRNLCARIGTKSLFSLPSLAALLRAFLVPFTLHPQVAAKKKIQPGSVLALPVELLGAFSRFVRSASLPSQTGAPRAGRLFPAVTNSPVCRAPMGLACLMFVRMPTPHHGTDLHKQTSKPTDYSRSGCSAI